MITKEKIIDGEPYLLMDVVPVSQKSEVFYLGKIKASDLVQIFIVDPTHYDIKQSISLSKSFVSDADYYRHIADVKKPKKDSGFQRKFKKGRATQIKKFLETKNYPFFPNTIIANCKLINHIEEFLLDNNSQYEDFKNRPNRPDLLSFLYRDRVTEQWKLLIPKKEGSVLVIDGQHRLEGLRQCSVEYQRNYDVLISFIIGYNRSVIAQQFYTINYEQKSVNRSLLLHLMGEFNQELKEITFLHNVAKLLNEHSSSPFQKRIKMLGVTPPGLKPDERRLLSVSQSFMIDHMMRFISSKPTISRSYPPIFLYYFQNKDYHINIIRFFIYYFSAIKEMKEDWETPENSVLSKGMGIGAFLSALYTIFPIMFIRDWKSEPDKIKKIDVNTFKNILSGIENIDFTSSGELAGSGGGGTINKIKTAILEKINYKDGEEKEKFISWLKEV